MAYKNTAKLECTETGHITYHVHKNKKKLTHRLELKKYNPKLRRHTLYKEVK